MTLINTTNSHSQLVKSQLESTDGTLVEVYSAGNTDVIFTQAPLHYEILISNKHRAIREPEIETIQDFFLKRKIDKGSIDEANIKTLYSDKLIEISIILLGSLLMKQLKNSNVVAINGELKLGKSSMELAKIHDFIQKVL